MVNACNGDVNRILARLINLPYRQMGSFHRANDLKFPFLNVLPKYTTTQNNVQHAVPRCMQPGDNNFYK